MDIDELIEQFIAAYDAWAIDEGDVYGSSFDAMVAARQALQNEQSKIEMEKTQA